MLSDKAIHRLSAPNPMTDKLKVDTENGKQEISPERNGILHVIASKSEMGGCKREEVRASDSPGGCVEIEEKKEAWDQAERNLEELIQQVIHEENSYQRARLPCRLLVLNIAAGAKERDLYEFFYRFRSSVRNIKILPSRDPISRTQIAHVDMSTRSIALEASYMTNNIFGLIPKIKLAVETGD
ncbi:hypothetical protein GQ44DRAFT_698563 [Phaeosphaeriaceae sp. PMI808]|nr:hypothetical protein GQ44DRAFT_698563 [Phaeosphaeriaceae sp. PMI808]